MIGHKVKFVGRDKYGNPSLGGTGRVLDKVLIPCPYVGTLAMQTRNVSQTAYLVEYKWFENPEERMKLALVLPEDILEVIEMD